MSKNKLFPKIKFVLSCVLTFSVSKLENIVYIDFVGIGSKMM